MGSLQLWNGSQYSCSSLLNNLTTISVGRAKRVLVFVQKTISSWEDQSSVEPSCQVRPSCWGVWLPAWGRSSPVSVSSVLSRDSLPAQGGSWGSPDGFVQSDVARVAPGLPTLNCWSSRFRMQLCPSDSRVQELRCSAASEPAPRHLRASLGCPSSRCPQPWCPFPGCGRGQPSGGPAAGTSRPTMQPVRVLSRTRAVYNLLYYSS